MNDYYEQDKFTDACNEYLEKNVIAEYVAFYFSYGYKYSLKIVSEKQLKFDKI